MLEEKDKEIEGLKVMKAQELAQYLKDALPQYINQDKISFAVEQLEKVKEFTDKAWWVDGVSECVVDYINDQIEELKKEKKQYEEN